MSLDSLIGRKVGMTSVFDENGSMHGVTVLEVGPNRVLARRTGEKDGYDAVVLGWGERRASRAKKPQVAAAKKVGVETAAQLLREVRCAADEALKAGDLVRVADVFEVGGHVDVVGTSRGKGFQGVRRRHKFNLGPASHGSKNYRETKSTGQNTWPARRWPGKRMAGHMGDARRTIRNLKVIAVDAERNYLMVAGPVPGWDTGLVYVRKVGARGKGRA
jgi:large subunit ribosomal protein L3